VLRLVNHYEEIAHGEIKAAADRWGLSVYPKVRVADVVPIDELGVVGEMKRYGLQSHFDFVVCPRTVGAGLRGGVRRQLPQHSRSDGT
jgi:hypothetical protein